RSSPWAPGPAARGKSPAPAATPARRRPRRAFAAKCPTPPDCRGRGRGRFRYGPRPRQSGREVDTPLGWTILARMSPLARAKAFVPCIRVGTETLVTTGPTFREVRMPVIELGFDYGGGERDAEGER